MHVRAVRGALLRLRRRRPRTVRRLRERVLSLGSGGGLPRVQPWLQGLPQPDGGRLRRVPAPLHAAAERRLPLLVDAARRLPLGGGLDGLVALAASTLAPPPPATTHGRRVPRERCGGSECGRRHLPQRALARGCYVVAATLAGPLTFLGAASHRRGYYTVGTRQCGVVEFTLHFERGGEVHGSGRDGVGAYQLRGRASANWRLALAIGIRFSEPARSLPAGEPGKVGGEALLTRVLHEAARDLAAGERPRRPNQAVRGRLAHRGRARLGGAAHR